MQILGYTTHNKKSWKYSCVAFAAVLVLFSSPLCTAFAATIKVPKNYKTIQEAVNKASYGDTVLVSMGTYTEHLLIKPGITVKSEGSEREHNNFTAARRTIIRAPGGSMGVVQGKDNTILNGFSMVNNVGGFSRSSAGVLMEGNSKVVNCIISNLPYNGISVTGGQAYISNNIISKNSGTGIKCEDGAKTRIIKNQIQENVHSGIENDMHTETEIKGNRIYKNGIDGIMNTGANPFITDNDISNNGLNGIGLQSGSHAVISNNIIHENTQAGVGIRSQAKAKITKNRIYGNLIGIGCLDLESAEIESNEIYKNLRIGIGLINCRRGRVSITNNRLYSNGFLSISPSMGCKVVQSGNQL